MQIAFIHKYINFDDIQAHILSYPCHIEEISFWVWIIQNGDNKELMGLKTRSIESD